MQHTKPSFRNLTCPTPSTKYEEQKGGNRNPQFLENSWIHRCTLRVYCHPQGVTAASLDGQRIPLNPLWNRRQCTKFNGTSYITQRGAEAIYTPDGQKQIKETINYYMENARIMREGLKKAGFSVYGGINAPYIWLKVPEGMTSWKFFDQLLYEVNIVSTPGVGFGPSGEGYLRLTAFGQREECQEAMQRLQNWI